MYLHNTHIEFYVGSIVYTRVLDDRKYKEFNEFETFGIRHLCVPNVNVSSHRQRYNLCMFA